MKKFILIIIGLAIMYFFLTYAPNSKNQNVSERVEKNALLVDEPISVETLAEQDDTSLVQALTVAINDEYKARATYAAVIEMFGEVRPFSNIIRAEEQHISALEQLFASYDLSIPEDNWYGQVQVLDSVSAMCAIGVQAEIENAALYRQDLIPAVVEYPEVSAVFTNLMSASENNHLPAFERCR